MCRSSISPTDMTSSKVAFVTSSHLLRVARIVSSNERASRCNEAILASRWRRRRLSLGKGKSSGRRLCAVNQDVHFLNILNCIIYVIILVVPDVCRIGSATVVGAAINFLE